MQVNQQINLRITEDGAVRDVQKIHELLTGNGIITQRNYDLNRSIGIYQGDRYGHSLIIEKIQGAYIRHP